MMDLRCPDLAAISGSWQSFNELPWWPAWLQSEDPAWRSKDPAECGACEDARKTLSQWSLHWSEYHSVLGLCHKALCWPPQPSLGSAGPGWGLQPWKMVSEEDMHSFCPREFLIYNLQGFSSPVEEKLFINPATSSIRHLGAIKTQ